MDIVKLPRLYVEAPLTAGGPISLSDSQTHYLRHVLRRSENDQIRLFNGHDGEWLAALSLPGRREAIVTLLEQVRGQPAATHATHLLFAPLKKDALDILVQKAVELGATHLQPVFTQNTDTRRINEARLQAQVIEAAEQCERLALPQLMPARDLADTLAAWDQTIPLFAALERDNSPFLDAPTGPAAAFLIGPEGGFTAAEREFLRAQPYVHPVSLGPAILRAETAALFCLSARLLAITGQDAEQTS